MKAIQTGFVLVVAALTAFGVSCAGERRDAAAPTVGPSATISTTDAADMLSQARCDFEVKCNKVGPTATYASRDHCMDVNRGESMSKFEKCERDVRRAEMQKCASEIRSADCGGAGVVVDAFERVAACHNGRLCAD